MDLIAHNFWWPQMGCYVVDYVKGCNLCNCTKTFPVPPTGRLMPNHIPNWHWQVISVDLITELLQSHSYDAIMVVVDHLSKCTHVILMNPQMDSQTERVNQEVKQFLR